MYMNISVQIKVALDNWPYFYSHILYVALRLGNII